MRSFKTLLLTGTALALLALPAHAAGQAGAASGGVAVAAKPADTAVLAAEKAVDDARAALRAAMASGKNVPQAKAALNKALKTLADARAAAGTPAGANAGKTPAPNATPPADAGTPPADAATPPADGATPPADGANPPPDGAGGGTPPADTGGGTVGGGGDTPPDTGNEPPPPPPNDGATPPDAGNQPPPAAGGGPTPTPTPTPPPGKGPKGPPANGQPPKGNNPPATPPPAATPPANGGGNSGVSGGAIGGAGDRVIKRDENGQVTIQHDDDVRFGQNVEEHKDKDGNTISTVLRPNGVKIVTTRDPAGNIVRRLRIMPNGQQQILIGDAGVSGGATSGTVGASLPPPKPRLDLDFIRRLPQLVVPIPQKDYVLQSDQASQQQIEQALVAPPVERVERPYTLEEIRQSGRLRDKLRRIDIDTVNFDFGQATVPDDQINTLQVIGSALSEVITRNPEQVFLIEGHTDAVGSDLANLTLSDRRAESVAEILTRYFNIPPENLVTQGYGEQYLKVLTSQAERENRRVTVRNITPLLRASQ